MHRLVAVVGASGGLGASTLAAALSAQLGAALVDGDLAGGGVDATMALEEERGLRWPDLAGLDGEVDAERLIARMPGNSVKTLSAARSGAPPGSAGREQGVPDQAVRSVLASLRGHVHVVLDLPAHDLASWFARAEPDLVVLLVGLRPRQVRDAVVMVDRLEGRRCGLVTRGTRRSAPAGEDVAEMLGVPVLDHLEDQPVVLRDEGRGVAPRPRGALGRVCRAVADMVGPEALEGERWRGEA